MFLLFDRPDEFLDLYSLENRILKFMNQHIAYNLVCEREEREEASRRNWTF